MTEMRSVPECLRVLHDTQAWDPTICKDGSQRQASWLTANVTPDERTELPEQLRNSLDPRDVAPTTDQVA